MFVYDYRRADFDGLRQAINNTNLTDLIVDERDSVDNVNECLQTWKDNIKQLINTFVPVKRLKRRKHSAPWITGEIIHAIHLKES